MHVKEIAIATYFSMTEHSNSGRLCNVGDLVLCYRFQLFLNFFIDNAVYTSLTIVSTTT